MGIQKSNLNNKTIQKILEQEYKIIPNKIAEINRGTANIFKINSQEGIYILKEFTKERTMESVEKEMKIINFLEKRNVNVPKYIKTKNNKFCIGNEGRVIVVQKFIEGYTMENNTGDYEKIIESATILGKLTKELTEHPNFSEENIIEKQFSKESIQTRIIKMKNLKKELKENNIYKNKIEQDLNDKIKILEKIDKNFDFNIIKKITIINSHGDYSVQQLIYNDQGETTVIDFETAKKLPIVWEIMRSYSYIDKEAKDGELNIKTLVQYFKEFCKYVKLNKYDLKYAPHIYLIQLAGSTFGYKQYNDDYTQEELLNFAFFRTNLCKYLYDNSEKIGLELSKEIK